MATTTVKTEVNAFNTAERPIETFVDIVGITSKEGILVEQRKARGDKYSL